MTTYSLAAFTTSGIHESASFAHLSAKWSEKGISCQNSQLEWSATEVEDVNMVNIYKTPPYDLEVKTIPLFPQSVIFPGEFNCYSTTWGYKQTSSDGSTPKNWACATKQIETSFKKFINSGIEQMPSCFSLDH
jgi:hypothetical protein